MFSIIHKVHSGIATREGVAMLIAFLIAEFFYKFRSFTLECLAFLVTWYVLGAVAATLIATRDKKAIILMRKE